MAWTKVKTAIVICACVLAAVTTTVFICYLEKSVRGIPPIWWVISGNSEQWNWTKDKIYAHSTTGDSLLASSKKYGDVTLSAVASTTNREASLAIRMQDANNGYIIIFAPPGTPRDDAGHISFG